MGTADRGKDRSSYQRGTGKAVEYLDDQPLTIEERLTGLNVKFDAGGILVTLKATGPSGKVVAFVGASSLPKALREAAADMRDGKLRWREDLPWAPKVDSPDDRW